MQISGTAKLKVTFDFTGQKENVDLSTPQDRLSKSYELSLTDGNGANQFDDFWHDQRTLAAAANETLDLYDALTNNIGDAITAAKCKALFIYNGATAGSDAVLSVGAAALNQFVGYVGDVSDVIKVPPGGYLLLTSPDANGVTIDGTHSDLKIANSSAGSYSATYDIIVAISTA